MAAPQLEQRPVSHPPATIGSVGERGDGAVAVFEGEHLRHDLETGVTEWARCVGCGNPLTSDESKARGYGDRCADQFPDEVLVVRLRVATRHDRERFRQWRRLREVRRPAP